MLENKEKDQNIDSKNEETPVEVETTEVEVEETLVEAEATEVLAEETPVEVETTEVEVEETLVEAEATEVLAEETPVEAEATEVLAEETPAEVKEDAVTNKTEKIAKPEKTAKKEQPKSNSKLIMGIVAVAVIGLAVAGFFLLGGNSEMDRVNYDTEGYIELGEYKGIEINEVTAEVTDEDVNLRIASDLDANRVPVESEGTVKDGDTVNIAYVGTKDGVAFDGGSTDGTELEIGSGTYIDGFEEGLIGVETGDTKVLELTFPDDYAAEDLAGADVEFEVTVNSITSYEDAVLNDEFAQTMGYNTVEEYETAIREELEASALTEAEYAEKTRVFQQIYNASEVISYPEDQVNSIIEETTKQFEEEASAQDLEWDTYVSQYLGIEAADYDDTVKEYAETTVKNELVIYGIAQAEGIEVTQDEVDAYVEEQLATIGLSDQEYKEYYGATYEDTVGLDAIYLQIYIDKVMEKVFSLGKIV